MKPVIQITDRDNVATALDALDVGRQLRIGDGTITVMEPIPRGHKIAVRAINQGEAVVKYGSAIGTASADIGAGAHVHTHNVASARGRGDLGPQLPADAPRIAEPPNDTTLPTPARGSGAGPWAPASARAGARGGAPSNEEVQGE